jgi:hypothetical protein
MMFGEGVKAYNDSSFTFYLYMPFNGRWEIVDPLQEIIEVKFPGFLIIKHKDLQDRNCRGLEGLKKVLGFTVKSVFYK